MSAKAQLLERLARRSQPLFVGSDDVDAVERHRRRQHRRNTRLARGSARTKAAVSVDQDRMYRSRQHTVHGLWYRMRGSDQAHRPSNSWPPSVRYVRAAQ